MRRSDSARFTEIKQWAKERGFFLGTRCRDTDGRYGWPLHWQGPDGEIHQARIADLVHVEGVIHNAISDGKAQRPGEWYLCWELFHTGDSLREVSWCPWHRWVHPLVLEGTSYKRSVSWSSDSTPYSSAEEALSASALLGLECGGRLHLTALVKSLSGKNRFLPTPANTPAAVDELILLYVARIKGGAPVIYNPEQIADAVQTVSWLDPNDAKAGIERLIADGRLIRNFEKGRAFPTLEEEKLLDADELERFFADPAWPPRLTLQVSEVALSLLPLMEISGDKSSPIPSCPAV